VKRVEHADRIDIIHHLADSRVFLGMDWSRFGVTRHVWFLWIAAAILIVLLSIAARQKGDTPRGFRNLLEPLLFFIRDQVVLPNMGEEGMRYLPFIWTLFLFILVCNLLGLVPGGATATANISVTAALAIISFIMIQFSGLRRNGFGYVRHLVPSVPLVLWPLMLVVELIGLVAKPFALAVRLWANMNAGHIVLLVLLGFIFTFKNWAVSGVSVAASVAISMLELFIALLQAYVFAFLTAVFMGVALHPEH
jgi:F-type H+-transporting ATPase subunit a